MLSKNLKGIRYFGIFLSIAVLCGVIVFPFLRGESAPPAMDDLQKEMDAVKQEMESPNVSPATMTKYDRIANALSNCGMFKQATLPTIRAPFAPAASLCLNGALAAADPDFNRPLASSTGTGIGNGTAGNCSLSGTATAANYDVYNFNLTGCTVFPTAVDVSTCGPAGCVAPGVLDTMLILYRNVPAGDPLTANGGLPGVFNPASPCTNARAGNDDSGATPTSAGGSTCSQTGSCLAQCTAPASTANSELRRNLGSGRFTVVIAGFGNTTVGSYNLYVNAPGAGCLVALSPLAASATISGRVSNSTGSGLSKVAVTLSGNGIERQQVYTNGFGYYTFGEIPVGDSYVLTVGSKQYTFNPATRVVNLEDNITDADFVSEQ
jgi:hypothetical protein